MNGVDPILTLGSGRGRYEPIVRNAPTVMSVTPSTSFQSIDSPRNIAASTSVSGRLSLSMAATRARMMGQSRGGVSAALAVAALALLALALLIFRLG